MLNGSYQDYNALQLELRRQFRHGIFGQINYTFSNTKADAIGTDSQNRIEPFLDNARPGLDDGRSIYDNRHVVNANTVFELPFGEGKRWLNGSGLSNVLAGGWQLGDDRPAGRAARRSVHPIVARNLQPHGPRRPADGGLDALFRPIGSGI